ncbi:carboxypeptidase-like regulatory domain-containing protein [Bacteroidota bacterium]
MNLKNSWLLFFLLIINFFYIPKSIQAQTGIVRGFIYEKETGEPVIFTNVYFFKTSIGAATDVNGHFNISKIPPGKYTLMVTALGYDTLSMPIEVKAGDIISKKLFLISGSVDLDVFNVTAERQEAKTETRTSVIKISPKQIKSIPTIGGQPDLAQYLQVLPGVIFTGDQGGQLYIRGGSPIQNKVLLDGMIIYNPFHSIGLFSVFDTDILRNAEVYTGGFGAEYGGRISSIMDLTTRDGNKNRIAGKINASTFGAKILLEGPLKKQTDESEGSSSFIFSAKNSYLEQSSDIFYEYIDTAGLPFNYTDLYGKISFNGANGSKINFFGFNFNDRVKYKAINDFHWDAFGAGTNFVIIPGQSSMLMEGIFAYSSYKISLEDQISTPRTSEINGFNIGLNFTYFLGNNHIKYGIELKGFKTDFNFFNVVNRKIEQTENTTEIAGFIKYKLTAGKFLIEPSIRAQYYASLSEFSPEPRLAIKYNTTDRLRLKMAGGFYSQNLISANSDRDIVNLFYGFLSGTDNLQEEFNGEEITSFLQKAEHIIFGIEYDLLKNITVNIEAYYKNFSQLTNINRNKIFDDNDQYYDKPDYVKKDFIVETGDAEGIDISVKYDFRRFYFWAVYSLGYVNRYDGINEYVPHYDRRHNVNLVGSYVLGENLNWEINVRWNYGSGFPFTQTQGFYGKINFNDGIFTDYISVNEELGIQYAKLNDGRLPTYHRLDITLKRKFYFAKHSEMEVNFSLTNVYDRNNIFYVDRIANEVVYQLPIMPSLGLSWTF